MTDGDGESYWAVDDGILQASVEIDLGRPRLVDRVKLAEYYPLGQRIRAFAVELHVDGAWTRVAEGTTVGVRRTLVFPAVTADRVRISILDAKACPTLATVEVYGAPAPYRL